MTTFFAIHKKSTQAYLPQQTPRESIGQTRREFSSTEPPRLYKTRRAASCSLTWWLFGQLASNFSEEHKDWRVILTPMPSRKKEDYEVVEVELASSSIQVRFVHKATNTTRNGPLKENTLC